MCDMKPSIDKTRFGSITIAGVEYTCDVVIRLDGEVKKRKKKLSKRIFGTSHVVSLDEIKYIYEKGADLLIVGSGQTGMLELSREAARYLKEKHVRLVIKPTPKAVELWNDARGAVIGLIHVTC